MRRVAARECGLDVAVIKVPTSLTPEAARRLSDDALAYRLDLEPHVVEYVLPHPLRQDNVTTFEDAVSAYDRRMGWNQG